MLQWAVRASSRIFDLEAGVMQWAVTVSSRRVAGCGYDAVCVERQTLQGWTSESVAVDYCGQLAGGCERHVTQCGAKAN